MKKSLIAIFFVILLLPLTQAFLPFTGFTVASKDVDWATSCKEGFVKNTQTNTCDITCVQQTNQKVLTGNQEIYTYCEDDVLNEIACEKGRAVYKRTICPTGTTCKDHKCVPVPIKTCSDGSLPNQCSKDRSAVCKDGKLVPCEENQICKNGQCTSPSQCKEADGLELTGKICPIGFQQTNLQTDKNICCIPIKKEPAIKPIITEKLSCPDGTFPGKCSDYGYYCTPYLLLERNCWKCPLPGYKCDLEDSYLFLPVIDPVEETYEEIKIEKEIKSILNAPSILQSVIALPQAEELIEEESEITYKKLPTFSTLFSAPKKEPEATTTHSHLSVEQGQKELVIVSGSSNLKITVNNGKPDISISFSDLQLY